MLALWLQVPSPAGAAAKGDRDLGLIVRVNAKPGARDWQLTRVRLDKVDGCRCPRLPDEPGSERGISRQCRREDFQRYPAVKAFVVGAVDDGHAALPDLLLQPVAGDPVARANIGWRRRGVVAHRTFL